MPFINSMTYYPRAGTEAEFRPIAEERVKAMQAAGVEASLSASWWGRDHPNYRFGQRYGTLAAYEQYHQADAEAARHFEARIASLTRQPPVFALSQSLQRTNQDGPVARWAQWVTFAPALGRDLDLHALLVDRGDVYETMGRRTTLSLQLAGPESGVFVRTYNYANLADLEEWHNRGAADDTQESYVQKLNMLLSRPLETSIRETIIPYTRG